MEQHDHVRVRNQLDGRWAGGFQIAREVRQDDRVLYEVTRLSDGAVLPTLFPEDELRVDGRTRTQKGDR